MPNLDLADISLHFEIDGKGPPVVLIAGMLSDSASWGPLLETLSANYTVIRPDNRTTGRTAPLLAPTSIEQNARDIHSLLQHLDLGPAHLIGHSMGGYIAAELASSEPQDTKSLTLLASAPMNLPRSWHLFQTLTDIRREGAPSLWLRALFPWLFHHRFFDKPENIEGAVAASLAYPFAQPLEAMQQQLDALKLYAPSELTKKISVPTLALLGQNDLIVPNNEALDLLSEIPQAKVHTIPNSAHSIHWDAPRAVLELLSPFLEKHRHAQ